MAQPAVRFNLARRTAMFHAQVAMGAEMAELGGWLLASHYGSAADEVRSLHTAAGIYDIGHMGQLRIVGREAATAARSLLADGVETPVGSVSDARAAPDSAWGPCVVACLALDEFAVLTPPDEAGRVVEALRLPEGLCAHVVDVSSSMAGVGLAGPAAAEALSAVTQLDLTPRALPDMACAQSRFAGVQGLLIRQDRGPTPAFMLCVSREYGEYFWEAMTHAVRQAGGALVGTEAVASLEGYG